MSFSETTSQLPTFGSHLGFELFLFFKIFENFDSRCILADSILGGVNSPDKFQS